MNSDNLWWVDTKDGYHQDLPSLYQQLEFQWCLL
jgi:hypothetical protein